MKITLLPDLSCRIVLPEVMDQPCIGDHELFPALDGLEKINRISATGIRIWRILKNWHRKTGSDIFITDFACGGGDILRYLARCAISENIPFHGQGIDLNERSCKRAQSIADANKLPLKFIAGNILDPTIKFESPIIISTLFLHHLESKIVQDLFIKIRDSGPKLLIISDICRTRLGYFMAYLAPRILSRSSVVHQDALTSVRAAFSLVEIHKIASESGLKDCVTRKAWPERFILKWENSK